jgi:TRAP-type C4-dicarboxylate transport system substrate-binding protein
MLLCGMIAVTVSGCTYVNNKSWDDMTPEEQEEVRQVFEEERKELEEDENMSDNGFAQYILDKVEEAVDTQSF